MMKEEVYRRLYLVLDELPRRCQEVFRYYLDGKKNSEIAEILHISELTVKAQKRDAIYGKDWETCICYVFYLELVSCNEKYILKKIDFLYSFLYLLSSLV